MQEKSSIEQMQEAERLLAGIGLAINDVFPSKGFAVIIFEFNQPNVSQYISNGSREDMIKALRETADRLEERQFIPASPAGQSTIPS